MFGKGRRLKEYLQFSGIQLKLGSYSLELENRENRVAPLF